MAQCWNCNNDVEEGDRFCSTCGTSLRAGPHASAFEIGKIAALDAIKKDILKWLGGTASILVAAFAILAYLGFNETIKSSVADEVKAALTPALASVDAAKVEIFRQLGVASQLQKEVSDTLTAQKGQISKSDATLLQLQKHIDETEQKREALEAEIGKLNAAAFIAKLRTEYLLIRDFYIKANVSFATPPANLNFSDQFEIDGHKDNNVVRIAQFFADSSHRTRLTEDSKMIGYQATFHMFSPYEDAILNKKIPILDTCDTVLFSLFSHEDEAALKSSVNNVKKIDLTIFVNYTPIWHVDLVPSGLSPEEHVQSDGTRWITYKVPIPKGAQDVTTIYDNAVE
jgi:hypothetical protein